MKEIRVSGDWAQIISSLAPKRRKRGTKKVPKRAIKKTKSSLCPKSPTCAYSFFMKDELQNFDDEVLKAPEGLNSQALARLRIKYIAAKWRSLKDKTKYSELAKEDKKRYEAEMALYRQGNPDKKIFIPKREFNMEIELNNGIILKKEKPKRPSSAMILYYLDHKKEIMKRANTEYPPPAYKAYLRVAGQIWRKELSQEIKDKYEQKRREQFLEYQAQKNDNRLAIETKFKNTKTKVKIVHGWGLFLKDFVRKYRGVKVEDISEPESDDEVKEESEEGPSQPDQQDHSEQLEGLQGSGLGAQPSQRSQQLKIGDTQIELEEYFGNKDEARVSLGTQGISAGLIKNSPSMILAQKTGPITSTKPAQESSPSPLQIQMHLSQPRATSSRAKSSDPAEEANQQSAQQSSQSQDEAKVEADAQDSPAEQPKKKYRNPQMKLVIKASRAWKKLTQVQQAVYNIKAQAINREVHSRLVEPTYSVSSVRPTHEDVSFYSNLGGDDSDSEKVSDSDKGGSEKSFEEKEDRDEIMISDNEVEPFEISDLDDGGVSSEQEDSDLKEVSLSEMEDDSG